MKKGRNEEDRHKSAATKELNGIEGKRCAWCDESETNDYINSKMVKILCNERSTIQLKKLYRDDEKTVDLFASVFLSTNPLPNFDSNDKAVIDRLRFIPFNARFFDLNNKMDKKEYDSNNENHKIADTKFIDDITKNHLDDFFTWLVDGYVRNYQRGHFNEPVEVFKACENVRTKKDTVAQFIAINISLTGDEKMTYSYSESDFQENKKLYRLVKTQIYDEYVKWCKDESDGGVVEQKSVLYKKLVNAGVRESAHRGTRVFLLKKNNEFDYGDNYDE